MKRSKLRSCGKDKTRASGIRNRPACLAKQGNQCRNDFNAVKATRL